MEPFKNKFSPELVKCLALHFDRHVDGFDCKSFEAEIMADLGDLELKQRARLIADVAQRHLPTDLDACFSILENVLHPGTEEGIDRISDENGICGWGVMPLGMIVSDRGLGDYDKSFALLKQMTKRATAEFDVRPFLVADQERALAIMTPWVKDKNVHVRRLVSEGTRPRLPWGMRLPRLTDDPAPVLPLLEALKDDSKEYVRRSVANHLNDIAKDHPDLVAGIAARWLQAPSVQRQRLVRHACRSLIKQGHEPTLAAFGLNPPAIRTPDVSLQSAEITFGQGISFFANLTSSSGQAQDLVIDYAMHFRKANGTLSPKVFKWTKVSLAPGETISLSKTHAVKPVTTRVHYPGTQAVGLRINGQDFGYAEFELAMPDNC